MKNLLPVRSDSFPPTLALILSSLGSRGRGPSCFPGSSGKHQQRWRTQNDPLAVHFLHRSEALGSSAVKQGSETDSPSHQCTSQWLTKGSCEPVGSLLPPGARRTLSSCVLRHHFFWGGSPCQCSLQATSLPPAGPDPSLPQARARFLLLRFIQ